MNKHKLISEVVDQGICIGCGVCAGICPGKNIVMEWSKNGELNPVIEQGCTPEVCVCISVCPILNPLSDQDENKTDKQLEQSSATENIIGNYISSYGGYSTKNSQRQNGSSGGTLTWLLTTLLEEKKIDGAIVVVQSSDPKERLFEFKILDTVEQIESASGSKYYPVEISDVMQFIRKDRSDKRYALVGLPCLITGITHAKKINKRLNEKVAYTFSLTCGQLPNRFYTEALASYSGVPVNDLQTVNFRLKEDTQSASNYIFKAFDTSKKAGKPLYWISQPSYLWENSFFVHGACKFCDDVFGRTADAIFMDAWLPRYSSDPKGHSFIVVKNEIIDTHMKAMNQMGKCNLESVNINDILQSQHNQIVKKTEILSAHLYMAQQNGIRVTKRNIQPDKQWFKFWKKDITLQWETMISSKIIWKTLKDKNSEASFFDNIETLNAKIQKRKRSKYVRQGLQKLLKAPHKTFIRVISHQINRLINKEETI